MIDLETKNALLELLDEWKREASAWQRVVDTSNNEDARRQANTKLLLHEHRSGQLRVLLGKRRHGG